MNLFCETLFFWKKIFLKLLKMIWENRELRVYYYPKSIARNITHQINMHKDDLDAVYKYKQTDGRVSKQDFLADSLERLKRGEHVYSYEENGELLHFGWFIENQEYSYLYEIKKRHKWPNNSAVLYDFFTVPSARGRKLYQNCIKCMLKDVTKISSVKNIYIVVDANNIISRYVIEKIGFIYEKSLFMKKILCFVFR